MPSRATSSIFLMHFGSNVGYAIPPLERLFYRSGLELAGGNSKLVHFGYPDFDKGHPRMLPPDFKNLFTFDFHDASPRNAQQAADYVKRHHIELVVIFDIQPVHPLFRTLRQAGARCILAYWGAPISGYTVWWKLLLKRLQIAASNSRVDGLIFESKAMADLAVRGRGVPERMIDVIPLGIDITQFHAGESDHVYRVIGFPRDRKVFVYAGHMEPRKGVATLVEAAIELLARRKRTDVCFLLCGNKGNESQGYESMYAGMGIDSYLRFGGYRNDMPEIYRSSYCGVIPSTGWDSFTTTSVEMAASGLPVIASNLQGLAEAVLDRRTGMLFEPGNAQQLADHIQELLEDPVLAAHYGREGRLRVERELSAEVQCSRFTATLRRRLLNS